MALFLPVYFAKRKPLKAIAQLIGCNPAHSL